MCNLIGGISMMSVTYRDMQNSVDCREKCDTTICPLGFFQFFKVYAEPGQLCIKLKRERRAFEQHPIQLNPIRDYLWIFQIINLKSPSKSKLKTKN
jgi:hypothetical protein